ncbi:hypothetical protein C0J52_34541 [Blattella germanica]|nr:hypothetical protein C0J52_34541 [Blattella germanica]
MLTLHLDCQDPKPQPVAGAHRFHVPQDALVYFRQEPGFKKKFLGSMQVMKIKPYPISMKDIGWTCSPNH